MTTVDESVAGVAAGVVSTAHFLVIDRRFGSPVFVFLQKPPTSVGAATDVKGRWVTLEPEAELSSESASRTRRSSPQAVGSDPRSHNHFAQFQSDAAVRNAGFGLIEPQYVGPTWEMYLSVFHPEGGSRKSGPHTVRPQRAR